MVTLFKISNAGLTTIWQVEKVKPHHLHVRWGKLDGIMQDQIENVKVNQSGRDIEAQLELRMQSRIKRQLDKGYCKTIEEARNSVGLNANKLYKPMLAQTYDRNIHTYKSKFFQYKYDGHRCIIVNNGDQLMAYSRNGKPINTIQHILNNIDIPEGTYLDGELYMHGKALQTISSVVRRVQPSNRDLVYMVYDQIDDLPFIKRYEQLYKFNLGDSVKVAPLIEIHETITNEVIIDKAISLGYEGIMMRNSVAGYEPGKRSSQLLKCKRWLDDEFIVKDVTASKDGWGILTCVDRYGRTFRVTAPGTMEQKTEVLENKENYIDRYITVEFANYTEDKLPFHPVAIRFRDEE